MTLSLTIGELKVIAETDHVQCGDAAAMARALLAAYEQEPVTWTINLYANPAPPCSTGVLSE